jgi:threonyl-tRNA synthetase
MIMEKMVTSYRDLPLKLAEGSGLYRNELSGTLTGLIRVRGPITQNDSHIYVTPNQLKKEFLDVLALFKEVYDEMGIVGYWFRLSLPDFSGKKMKFGGNREQWEKASQAIREALEEFGTPYVEAVGEAAFYGPKVDVQIKNVTGKEDSIATSQVDILVPERMGLTYIDESGQEKHPIIIHRAILGSYERFIGFLIEQTAGNFPFWLAPQQIALLPVGTDYQALAHELADVLKEKGLRVEVDDSDETVGKKIRQASLMKVPVKIVLGEKEAATKTEGWNLQLNWRQDLAESAPATLTLKEFIEYALSLNKA